MKREPKFNDSFYSSDRNVLKEQFDSFSPKHSNVRSDHNDTIALISPHAGYSYSGNVAYNGYQSLRVCNISTFIVLAPCVTDTVIR